VQQLGDTRSVQCAHYILQTPETFVRAGWPGLRKAAAIVHISRAGGAAFAQYTVEFEAGGELPPAVDQRFLYVLDGKVKVDGDTLGTGDFAYISAGDSGQVTASTSSRVAVVEKPYQTSPGTAAPARFVGRESACRPTYLNDDPWLEVRALVPDDPAIDFRVNTMTYRPGASLPAVEIHVMEHGLLMLEGGGIYRLGQSWYPVREGDFIWMAPYCPQWFGAIGKTPAKYLIYKDWARHPR
jgi:(S)-ureidoglycine aminohydrolase